jgi:uncharacterized protein with HEPN domain
MTRRDDSVFIQQMLVHAEEALSLVAGLSQPELEQDRVLSLAVLRLLEIVGEAAARISPELRETHGRIPWSQIVALRNRLIHGYDAVDMSVIWQILISDLPELVGDLRELNNK